MLKLILKRKILNNLGSEYEDTLKYKPIWIPGN